MQWSDVADIVDELGEALAPSNAAYALFRLGCLNSFMSAQRKQGRTRNLGCLSCTILRWDMSEV